MTTESTVEGRLRQAMQLGDATAADLAASCGISRTAVGKWLKGQVENLKNEHLFKVADLCGVSARWLGTGEGSPRGQGAEASNHMHLANGLPEIALRVARKWSTLDEPARSQVLMLIETLGALQNENYLKWGVEQQRAAKKRAKEHA